MYDPVTKKIINPVRPKSVEKPEIKKSTKMATKTKNFDTSMSSTNIDMAGGISKSMSVSSMNSSSGMGSTMSSMSTVVTSSPPPPQKHNVLRKTATSYSEVKANNQTTISNHANSLNLEEKGVSIVQAVNESNLNKHIEDATGR